MAKTKRVHRHCGGKVSGNAYCERCHKWLTGDSVVLVKVGKPGKPQSAV